MLDIIQARVDEREMGKFPISIGTSLALEGALGIYPDNPVSPPPLFGVKNLMINVATLVRNIYQCLDSAMKDIVLPDHIYDAAIEEMKIIKAIIDKEARPGTRLTFYHCSYRGLDKMFRGAKLRTDPTAKQLSYMLIEKAVLKRIIQEARNIDLLDFDVTLSGAFPSSMILTHLPVDLLSYRNFERLELLESHTGKVKPRTQWYTKLTNGKEHPNIPFHKLTLQVFGDGGGQFLSNTHALKKEVLSLANTYSWTPVTTNERILDCVGKITDPVTRGLLRALL